MRIRFILAEVFRGLARNRTMVASIVLVTFVSLAFVGASALIQRQVGLLKGDWYDLVEVSVYLCPNDSLIPSCANGEASAAQIADIKSLIDTELGSRVSSVVFETKEEALAAVERLAPEGFQGVQLSADDMQASLRIKLNNPNDYRLVSDILSGRPGVEDVVDHRAVFQPLFTALNKGSLLAAGLAVLMLIAAVLLISTTIKLSAVSRQKETSLMRLVGASNWVVQLPFILEGAIAAMIGSLLAIGGLWLGARLLITDWLKQSVNWIAYVGTADVVLIAPALVGIAVLLAAISSGLTLNKYTRV